MLPEDKAGLAGGLILGVAGFGNAAGPLIGGFLTDALSWRWVLFLNLPIAAIACYATWRAIPEDRPSRERIDYPGIATLTVGLIALLIALDQVTDWGWACILVLFGLCALLLVAFVAIERRADTWALIPRDVRQPGLPGRCLATR